MTNGEPVSSAHFNPYDPPSNPLELFDSWFKQAELEEPSNHNAMTVATVDADGRPSARIILLKGFDDGGFTFYTNTLSRKGGALAANPVAALCFYWKSSDRQIRVEGAIIPVTDAEADAYFASRPRGSRIGAWASQQSQPLAQRQILETRVTEFEAKYPGEQVDRPPHWSGYRLVPDRIEFWNQGEFRLHDRLLYTRADPNGAWATEVLYP
ncbi:MAG: pyridoxamine 5'-phosphate oxidase [Pseudomonadota bacterium]